MTDLKITLIRSAAHRLPEQRKIVKALGLGRVDSTVVLPYRLYFCDYYENHCGLPCVNLLS